MAAITLSCPFCGSEDAGRNGHTKGKQRYVCKTPNVRMQRFTPNTGTTAANRR